MAVASCPGCGGAIEFSIGSSIVVICDHCRSVVARTDRALENLGRVSALIDTGSPLFRNQTGKFEGAGFRLVGRTQMEHESGGRWDEWYAAFDDGRWGWVAEAQGRFYVTFLTTAGSLPSFDQIEVGGEIGDLVVTEIGSARVLSGEGEIPWRPVPGRSYDYADLSGSSGRFATVDYSDAEPALFLGSETTLEGLGLQTEPEHSAQIRKPRVGVEKLSCANCGGPLSLVAPDRSERIICPNCGGAHDVTSGNLRFLEVLKIRGPKPTIDLGAKGTIDGAEYVVAGYMRRYVVVEGKKYPWGEYLLFHPQQGFRWLVESDLHWSFVWPIAASEVVDRMRGKHPATSLVFEGKDYAMFQVARATVESVIGEFYWKAEAGEKVRTVDYIRPPLAISKETIAAANHGSTEGKTKEVSYSQSRYLTVAEVEESFSISGLKRPSTVGMQQPNRGASIVPVWLAFLIALVVLAILLALRAPHRDVFSESYDFGAPPAATVSAEDQAIAREEGTGPPPSPAEEPGHVIFSKPFVLSGGNNLEIAGSAPVDNSWVYVSGDLVNEQTGLVEAFELPVEYYHGVDGGESWSEGSQSASTLLASLPPGRYVMRLEGQWAENTRPPAINIRAREGVFLWSHLFLAFLALTLMAFVTGYRSYAFEKARWAESSLGLVGGEV